LQALPRRRASVLRLLGARLHDRQHARRGPQRHRQGNGAGSRDGRVRGSLRLQVHRAREGRRQSIGPRRARLRPREFIAKAENIVFIGGTGVGKTGLASGLLLNALQNGHRAVFMRAQDLFDEMYASLADRSTRKLLNRLISVDVLLIDEMGYLNLKPEQTNIFFKLMEDRYRRKPTIITTNLDYSEWGSFLGNKALVDALLSRLRHQCHTVKIDGPTLRDATG
jgi:DNA replication protein DnaC